MTLQMIEFPKKTREFPNEHFNSAIWNDFQFREDDIIISTYAKAGTTWMQQIVAQLIFNGKEGLEVAQMSPWLDFIMLPKAEILAAVEAQTHRRFLKTHLPVDALVFSPQAKYIYVGRDGRDIVWSLYNYQANINETGVVQLGKPPESILDYFHDWLDKDGYPFWSFWEHVRSWWEIKHLPNVLLVHFANLKQDLPGEIRRIAEFLEIDVKEDHWDSILQHCSFNYMKQNATKIVANGGNYLNGGAQTFLHKGTNGRWRDMLTAEEIEKYEQMAEKQLGDACAHWLMTGELSE